MSRFIIDSSFSTLFPAAQIGVVVAHHLDQSAGFPAAELAQANRDAQQFLGADPFSQNPVVQTWRAVYHQFKTKKGARSSIEALLKRVDKGQPVHPIAPLVDAYNTISLRYGLPVGGEDLATFVGDMHLTVATGGEAFWPLGSDHNEPALPGEVIYRDQQDVICRCFNWREGQRTLLTDRTRDAVFVLEQPQGTGPVAAAVPALADLLTTHFQATVTTQILTAASPELVLD